NLTLRRFTPLAERIFNLIPADVGRPFSYITRNSLVPIPEKAIQEVLDTLAIVDREVQDREGHWYSLRIRPYRTRENKIEGVVVMVVDIDDLRRVIDGVLSTVNQPL